MAQTVEEFYRTHKETSRIENQDRRLDFYEEIFGLMKGFAEMHSRQALEAAAEKVFYTTERDDYRNIKSVEINKESILNAYPSENIK